MGYMGTSLIRNLLPQEPYSRSIPRAIWWSLGGGLFLMSEVPVGLGAMGYGLGPPILLEKPAQEGSFLRLIDFLITQL